MQPASHAQKKERLSTMREQYNTENEKRTRVELEKTRLFYLSVITGEILAALTVSLYCIFNK